MHIVADETNPASVCQRKPCFSNVMREMTLPPFSTVHSFLVNSLLPTENNFLCVCVCVLNVFDCCSSVYKAVAKIIAD